MGLPEHSCISCAHLVQSGNGIISLNQREQALIDENNILNTSGINYEMLICHKGKRDYSEFNTNNKGIDIHNGIIEPNPCEDWTIFQDAFPQGTEQITSNKWIKISIMVAKISLAVAFVGMVMTFIITMIIWYLD